MDCEGCTLPKQFGTELCYSCQYNPNRGGETKANGTHVISVETDSSNYDDTPTYDRIDFDRNC